MSKPQAQSDRAPARPRGDYRSGDDSHRRAPKTTTLKHEDHHLKALKRKRLVAATRDAVRNFVLVGAAVRKHLDFVTKHSVDFDTGDGGLDRDLEQFVDVRSREENFDRTGSHDRDRYVRLLEARRVIDGDVGSLKLADRRLQAIEGDRIRDPDRKDLPDNQRAGAWYQGVRCDGSGRPVEYAIARRTGSGFAHERVVRSSRMIFHSWIDSHFRFDACRGVSPFAAALDDFIDQHETLTHAQAKVKLAQVLGLKVTNDSGQGLGVHSTIDEGGDDDNTEGDEKYQVDLGKGPFKIELNPGDDVDVIEGKTAVEDVVSLLKFVSDLAIQVLDLPPHFFDTARVNFHGGKVGTTLYLQSAQSKRADVQRFLSKWLNWQIGLAITSGEIVLPRSIDVPSVLNSYAWIPSGLPWFDRGREVRPTLQAIAGGVDSYSRVIQELYGIPLERFLARYKRDVELIAEAGVDFANWDRVIMYPDAESEIVDE